MTSLTATSDWALIQAVRNGDQSAAARLVNRYVPALQKRLSTYFLRDAEGDDVLGEGLLGFAKAIRDFNPEAGASFHGFALACAERQVKTAVKRSLREKHGPLSEATSLQRPTGYGSGTLEDLLTKPDEGKCVDNALQRARRKLRPIAIDLDEAA